jgi:hypothetical protein
MNDWSGREFADEDGDWGRAGVRIQRRRRCEAFGGVLMMGTELRSARGVSGPSIITR